ncbi:MAG TPA: hypothetical protein VFB15_01250 [Candidatus Binataceae bacterium]|nr:hypothetical protein [Candidatus Binataceae bacterium]
MSKRRIATTISAALAAVLVNGSGCSHVPPPPPPQPITVPLVAPTVAHKDAAGCDGAHDTVFLPGASIDAYPSLPPRAQPKFFVINLNDGTSVWGKPYYNDNDCANYLECRRATFVLNPSWNDCRPSGNRYEVATLDSRLVLSSTLFQVTDLTTDTIAYVGFACGQGFAESDLSNAANRVAHPQCSSAAPSAATGANLAKALALGAAYFSYRAAYNRPVRCFADDSRIGATTACYQDDATTPLG